MACGYKAKVLCSALFVCGRELDCERAPEISEDSYRLLRLFRATVDRPGRAVTASFFGAWPQTAVCRVPSAASTATAEPVEGPPGLCRVLASAFTEPDPARLRRTRAVVVMQDGKLLAERYAPGFAPLTPLPGWSMTKSLFSALVGVLVGEGRLRLTDRKLISEWSAAGDPRARISLEDLLRMRSGLAFSEVYSDALADVTQMLFARDDAAAYAAAKPLAQPPGSVWNYSSGSSNIVSSIVRGALGEEDYAELPRRALFGPLGMPSARLEMDPSGTYVASSFAFATARDWARFGQLYAQDGVWEGTRLLPEGWVRFSTSPTAPSEGRYGAQWWLRLHPELGGDTEAAKRIPQDAFYALGHEGQVLTVIPSLRLVIVRMGLSIKQGAWDQAAFLADVLSAL